MPQTFVASDRQFSTATGPNVNAGPGEARFDDRPVESTGLTISSEDGDVDPRDFQLGDEYDLTWTDEFGRTRVLENAQVVRADDTGPDGNSTGIVVFRGVDNFGEVTEVVWTPGIDLEDWYEDSIAAGMEPRFYTSDQQAGDSVRFVCFERGTRLLTERGQVAAAAIRPGDRMVSWDGGLREVRWTGRRRMPGHGAAAPVRFETGMLGNARPLKLSPQHRVLIASGAAARLCGSKEVLVPAIALVNGVLVRQRPRPEVCYVHLLLDRHAILLAEGGAPCESLLPGPQALEMVGEDQRDGLRAAMRDCDTTPARPLLTDQAAAGVLHQWRVPPRGVPAL